MRVIRTKRGMPWRGWYKLPGGIDILNEAIVRPRGGRGMGMKLLVFVTRRGMRAFWSQALGRFIGVRVRGVVSALACEKVPFAGGVEGSHRMEVDPLFFSVMGLVAGDITLEVIAHECGHAALNYARRVHAKDMWCDSDDLEDERICYPAGRLTAQLIPYLTELGYLKTPLTSRR